MGCCSSTTVAKTGLDEEETQNVLSRPKNEFKRVNINGQQSVAEPSLDEKRRRQAEAAELRQANWRQGGAADEEKAVALRMRREKDELLGRIYNRYTVLGKEPPIGLPSCDVNQLKRHLATLK